MTLCYHPYFLYLDDFLLEKETQKVNVKFRRKNIDESCYKLQQIYRKIPCTLFCWFYNSTKEILAVYIFFLADIGEKEKTQYTYINTIKSYSKWHYIKWFENFYSAHDYYLRSCSEKAQFHLFNNHLRIAKIYNQGN